MSSNLSSVLTSLSRKAEQFISSAATSVTNIKSKAAQVVFSPFHDKSNEIDEIKNYLAYLSTPGHKFTHKGHNTALVKERATLADFRDHVKQLLANDVVLFNLDLSKHKNHQKPFNDLIRKLQSEIDYLEANPGEKHKALSEETLSAVDAALRKLQQLKIIQAGALTSTARLAEASPELLQSIDLFSALQKAILSGNSKKISDAFNNLKPCIDSLVKHKDTIFYNPPLTPENELLIQEFQDVFKAYENLPSSLKQDSRFHPNDQELMNGLKKTISMLVPYMSSQQTIIKKKLNSLLSSKNNIIDEIKNRIGFSSNSASSYSVDNYSSVQKLSDAIAFFTGPGHGYQDKKDVLLQLIQECDESHAGFQKHFLDAIAKTNPKTGPLSHDFAKEHLLDYPQVLQRALKIALKEAATTLGLAQGSHTKDELLEFLNRKDPSYVEDSQNSTTSSSSNPLVAYANEALKFFKGKGSLPESFLNVIGGGFTSILNNDLFNQWISKQNPEAQISLNEIKTKTLNSLAIALNSKALADYKAAFQDFVDLFNKPIVLVDGFALNTLFQDKVTAKTQVEATDKLNKTMTELRKALNLAKTEEAPDFDWTDEEKTSEKINHQLQELSDNIQDQSTYQFIYETFLGKKLKGDLTFFNIKALQKLKHTPQAKKKLFISELKKAIDNSDASWIKKTTAKFILPKIHKLIGYYSNNIITRFYRDIDKQLEKIDKQDILKRSSNCFSKYNALLKAWANDPKGGDKYPVIDDLMKNKEFLSYSQESYTQDELYSNVSNTFIYNYFDLYKGHDGQDSSLTNTLGSYLTSINKLIQTRPFYAGVNPVISFLNYFTVGVKAVLIGIPSHVIIRTLSLPIAIIEGLTNKFIKYLFSKSLEKFKAIDSVIHSTRNGIYENNPYVHAITSFLADQLESLSQELEGVTTADKNDTDSSSSLANESEKAVSEKRKNLIKQAAANLLEVINKNAYQTQDQLKYYLDPPNRTIATRSLDKLNQTILPLAIDSIVDTLAMASANLLNKKTLQQPISLLLDKLNDILLEPSEDLDDEKARIEKLKYQAAEDKLNKYTEKLIDQVITKTIDKALELPGKYQTTLVNETTEWLQTETPEFIEKFRNSFEDLHNSQNLSDTEFNQTLEDLFLLADKFLIELRNKGDLIKQDSSVTGKKLSQSLLMIIDPLEKLLHGVDKKSGFIGSYENQKLLYKTKEDLVHLKACDRAYEALQTDLGALVGETSNKQFIDKVFAHSRYIKKTLSKISTKEFVFSRERSKYSKLYKLLESDSHLMSKRNLAELAIQGYFLPLIQSIDAVKERADGQDLFDLLTTQKTAQLNTNTGFFSSVRGASSPFLTTYKETLKQIEKIPSDTIKKNLTTILNKIYYAKDVPTLTAAVTLLKNELSDYSEEQRTKFVYSVSEILAIDEQFYQIIHEISQEFEADVARLEQENDDMAPDIRDSMEAIEAAVDALETIPVVDTKTGVTDLLKTPLYQAAYHLVKPKITGIFDLLKDGNFSQFFANHALLMPFIKK